VAKTVSIYETDFGPIHVKGVTYKKHRYISHCGCDDETCCPPPYWETYQKIDKIQLNNGMWFTEDQLLELAEIFAMNGIFNG
jgi:hypothetical protein